MGSRRLVAEADLFLPDQMGTRRLVAKVDLLLLE